MAREKDILTRCQQGDEKAQLWFFREYAPMALRTAWRYVGNEDDAREVMQESMIKVFENLHKFRGDSMISTWVSRIVINHSLNFLRKKGRATLHFTIQPTMEEEMADVVMEDTYELDVREALELMAELPQTYQLVFNLFAIDGLTHLQIAETLGITEANSRKVLMRGRKMLKKLVEKKMSTKDHEQKKAY